MTDSPGTTLTPVESKGQYQNFVGSCHRARTCEARKLTSGRSHEYAAASRRLDRDQANRCREGTRCALPEARDLLVAIGRPGIAQDLAKILGSHAQISKETAATTHDHAPQRQGG